MPSSRVWSTEAQAPVRLSPGPVEISPSGKGHGQPCKTQVSPSKVVQPPSQPWGGGGCEYGWPGSSPLHRSQPQASPWIPEGHPRPGTLQTLHPLVSLCDRWGVSHAECDSVSSK